MTPKIKKILMIAVPAAAVIIAAVIVAVLLIGKNDEAYRNVKIYHIDGVAEVTKASGEKMSPYENMMLETDDAVKTGEDSRLYLKLDNDKYLMAGPNASFKLSATGSAENSKTRIDLEYGDIVIHVTEPLLNDSSFDIGTGSSTMAVRGTSFRIYTSINEDGSVDTVLQVFDGEVGVKLINPDGSISDEQKFAEGSEVIICKSNTDITMDKTLEGIDYFELDVATLEFLKVGIEEGNDVGKSEDEIDEIIEAKQKTLTVTFVFEDTVFATLRVPYGTVAKQPMLMPSESGEWDFDFSTLITEDTTINWINNTEE